MVNNAQLAELAELVKELAVVHGRVTLSSGKEADYYVDFAACNAASSRVAVDWPAAAGADSRLGLRCCGRFDVGGGPGGHGDYARRWSRH